MLLIVLAACGVTKVESPVDSAAALDPACEVLGERPAGWGTWTHDNETDPDYDQVFDRSSVLEITITVSAADYAAMYAEMESLTGGAFGEGGGGPGGGGPGGGGPGPGGGGPGNDPNNLLDGDPSYVPVTVQAGESTWCSVGMRFKGNSTLSQTWQMGIEKLPFRLNFDRYEDDVPAIDDQRFYGFKELSFGNNMGDATYVRDVMASSLLEARDIPAARNRFVAVNLDSGDGPVYLGLYTMAEDPSDELARRVWGDDDGALYEADGDCADLTCYDAASFEAKMNEDIADGAAVQALVDALQADDLAALEAVLDVDAWLRWFAMNTAMENWDTYGALGHNFYLYALPSDGGRLHWVPWDHNLSLQASLQGSSDPLYADIGDEWPLIRRLLNDPEYEQVYLGYLEDSLSGAYEPARFEEAAEGYRALIAPYVVGEHAERAESTFVADEAAWDAAYEALYEHVESRQAEVRSAL